MKYEKPEVAPLADALSAIQGCAKGENPDDSTSCGHKPSASAYEADE